MIRILCFLLIVVGGFEAQAIPRALQRVRFECLHGPDRLMLSWSTKGYWLTGRFQTISGLKALHLKDVTTPVADPEIEFVVDWEIHRNARFFVDLDQRWLFVVSESLAAQNPMESFSFRGENFWIRDQQIEFLGILDGPSLLHSTPFTCHQIEY